MTNSADLHQIKTRPVKSLEQDRIKNKKMKISKINFLSKRKSYVRKRTAQIVLGVKQPMTPTTEPGHSCGGCGGCRN